MQWGRKSRGVGRGCVVHSTVELKLAPFFLFQDIQWRRETIKEETTTSVCLKREFSEEDARQLGLERRIGVGSGYNSHVARETEKREPRLDASCSWQPGAEVCTQPVSPPSQLATFQHAASSRLYGLWVPFLLSISLPLSISVSFFYFRNSVQLCYLLRKHLNLPLSSPR